MFGNKKIEDLTADERGIVEDKLWELKQEIYNDCMENLEAQIEEEMSEGYKERERERMKREYLQEMKDFYYAYCYSLEKNPLKVVSIIAQCRNDKKLEKHIKRKIVIGLNAENN